MKIWTIATYTFLRQIRDYKSMAAFMILPIVMILVLGSALDSFYSPKTIALMKVGTYSGDRGFINDSLKQFLTSNPIANQIETLQAESVEAGIERVKSDEWDAFIAIQPNTSEALQQGDKAALVLYSQTGTTFAGPLLESFVRDYNLNAVLLSLSIEAVNGVSNQPIVKQIPIVTEGKKPGGMDYYAVTTMFQCLLFGALFGVFAVTKDLGNYTHRRLLTTPVRSSAFMTGKLLGSTAIVFMIALFIFIVTKFGFKSNWDGNLELILSVLLLFSIIAAAMGMLLGYLTKSTMISSLLMFILSTVFTLVAGGFSPMKGKLIELLSKLSPNTYAQEALFTNIYEDKIMLSPLIRLVLFAGIVICLTVLAGRRRVQ
ncbi:MAG: ABC transporter permease [Candidatus Cohnella colombiensis]|uniref:ABC transporter permease n=1 Tax=Candidatus Cohnella colombiensis TaxID=3121368 RepID=A0AA95F2S5_9BACL|nr:MAG: ABC transporter permease [Cohnella sp.]